MAKETLSADGATTPADHHGGRVFCIAAGTFGGGTLTVQLSPDAGTTWVDTSVSFTADGYGELVAPPGVQRRANLAGATTPTVDVWFF